MLRGLCDSLALFLGQVKIPEGFSVALPQTVLLSGTTGVYAYQISPKYDFWLQGVVSKWTAQTVDSNPSLEIFRDQGSRALQNEPIDLTTISTPAIAVGGVASLNALVGVGMLFSAGSVLQMSVTGHIPGSPASMRLVALGRYVRKQGND